MMTRPLIVGTIFCVASVAGAQQPDNTAVRRITLDDAVALALEHNHLVRIAGFSVEEKEHATHVARGEYFPKIQTETSSIRLSDTQLIEIPAGGLGAVGGAFIPPRSLIINQGAVNAQTFGVGATQPLTQLLRIKAANDAARADARATVAQKRGIEDSVTLKVHQIYFGILINQARRSAVEAKGRALEELRGERVQQAKYGSAIEADVIESRAYTLQARQELLSTDLQLSDLHTQFNDLVGLPLSTSVTLDQNVTLVRESCERDECVRVAVASHPDIAEARAKVDRAESAVRLAQYQFIPDVEVFARYSWQRNVPFLASNFATIGIHLTYDLFDGGKRTATIHERNAQLAQAKETLARVSDEVEMRVQTAYNKLERTREMVAVSTDLLALRGESRRVSVEQLAQGSALRSQVSASLAQEFEARAALLQSQLEYVQAVDEMDAAIGRRPR